MANTASKKTILSITGTPPPTETWSHSAMAPAVAQPGQKSAEGKVEFAAQENKSTPHASFIVDVQCEENTPHHLAGVDLALLEDKRIQLDQHISQYIHERQKEYNAFKHELQHGLQSQKRSSRKRSGRDAVVPSSESQRSADKERTPRRNSHSKPSKPKPRPLTVDETQNTVHVDQENSGATSTKSPTGSGAQTPVRERDGELTGLFIPGFLPLLDSRTTSRNSSYPPTSPSRSLSAPILPTRNDGKGKSEGPQENLKRLSSEPVIRPQTIAAPKRSSMRQSPTTTHPARTRKKRVSLAIADEQIVRPSDNVEDHRAPALAPERHENISDELSLADIEDSRLLDQVPLESGQEERRELVKEGAVEIFAHSQPESRDPFTAGHSTTPSRAIFSKPPTATSEPSTDLGAEVKGVHDITSREALRSHPVSNTDGSHSSLSPPVPIPPKQRPKPQLPDPYMDSDIAAPGVTDADDVPGSSYVGGLEGSGVDDIDQNSVGYPSSVGASYMEQFAVTRDLEKRAKEREDREERSSRSLGRSGRQRQERTMADQDDEGIMGSMDDF